MNLVKAVGLSTILIGLSITTLFAQEKGHFSSWTNVPTLIESISETNYREPLEQLQALTWIKLGYPQSSVCLNDEAHKSYMLQTRQKWQQWWESTGEPVSVQKEKYARIDHQAFQMAWNFLGKTQEQPKSILPVWIPKAWTLYVTFKNGDYLGREIDIWIIDRQAETASLTRLRGSHINGGWKWETVLTQYEDFSPVRADQVLKALCYLHRYAPAEEADVPENELQGLYYPHSTLHLRDSKNRILWNTEGYDFLKAVPEFGEGEAGRSYYFLTSVFDDVENWKVIAKPMSGQLAPYRRFLSYSKPYFCSYAFEIVRLFGQHGGALERQALLGWAEKQQAATNPDMDWKTCCSDFGTGGKVNIVNSTRLAIKKTLKEVKRIGDRLAKNQDEVVEFDIDRTQEKELERYVADMFAAGKSEKEDSIRRYPQPLRELVRINERRDDSELRHLSVAIQSIREQPDPKLFKQLIQEMDEGTLKIRSLLENILLNEHGVLKLKPWEDRQEAIAIGSCIESLPLAQGARDELIVILLRVCGGGKIEIDGPNGGRSIEVTVIENGYQTTFGNAFHPLSMVGAQQALRHLYAESKLAPKKTEQANLRFRLTIIKPDRTIPAGPVGARENELREAGLNGWSVSTSKWNDSTAQLGRRIRKLDRSNRTLDSSPARRTGIIAPMNLGPAPGASIQSDVNLASAAGQLSKPEYLQPPTSGTGRDKKVIGRRSETPIGSSAPIRWHTMIVQNA